MDLWDHLVDLVNLDSLVHQEIPVQLVIQGLLELRVMLAKLAERAILDLKEILDYRGKMAQRVKVEMMALQDHPVTKALLDRLEIEVCQVSLAPQAALDNAEQEALQERLVCQGKTVKKVPWEAQAIKENKVNPVKPGLLVQKVPVESRDHPELLEDLVTRDRKASRGMLELLETLDCLDLQGLWDLLA